MLHFGLVALLMTFAATVVAAPSIQEATRGLEKQDGFFPIKAGDTVKFRPIGKDEFERLAGGRL